MAADLDGPRIEPRSGTAKKLVVFLHGYGADGNDLIEIGRAWQQLLPEAAFVSPHAPEPCGQAPVGRQWFALTFRDPNERWIGMRQARPVLERFVAAELRRLDLPPSALALVGFSQGTMMALHVGLRSATPPAAIVGYSGRWWCRRTATWKNSQPKSAHGRRCSWSTAKKTTLFRRRLFSRRRKGWRRSTCRCNGTCRPASGMASTRKGCATAASSWRTPCGASDAFYPDYLLTEICPVMFG